MVKRKTLLMCVFCIIIFLFQGKKRMIRICGDLIELQPRSTTYLMRILAGGQLENVCYGRRIDSLEGCEFISENFDYKLTTLPYADEEHSRCFPERLLYEYPTAGRGDYRTAAIECVYSGNLTALELRYRSSRIFSGKCNAFPAHALADESTQTLEITLADDFARLAVRLYYTVYEEEDIILRSAAVVNESSAAVRLDSAASLCLDFSTDDFILHSYDGAWARERCEETRKLLAGITVIDSKLGCSGNEHSPLVYLEREGFDEVWGVNLIYSGSHRQLAEVSPFGKTRLISGINPSDFEYWLEPGETFHTPEAVLTYSSSIEDAAWNFHRFINKAIIRGRWKDRARPVLINSWEACYFDISAARLSALADKASELGCELFVLDDGWFSTRRNETAGLGDWTVSADVFPQGLADFAASIRQRGMMFGLWIEPEMVNKDSRLYEEHPDWLAAAPGREPVVCRHQHILDLTRREVRDYLFDSISEVLAQCSADYVKWDFNRTFADCAAGYNYRYVLSLYELVSRFVSRFPDTLFECCASGGNRYDLGMLCFMSQVWTSDDTDLYHRLAIQEGTLAGFPLSTMANHVSASPAHQSLRTSRIDSRFDVASFGLLGYELDLCALSPADSEAVREQIAFYKEYRPVFQYGRFRKLRSRDSSTVWWSVSKDDVTIVMQYVVLNQVHTGRCDRLVLPFAGKDKTYRITKRAVHIDPASYGSMKNAYHRAEGEECCMTVSGSILSTCGVALPPQFMGNGFSPSTRVIADHGTRMYIVKEVR